MQQESNNHSLRIGELIKQHIDGELDKNGELELQAWIGESKANRQLFEELTDNASREKNIQERREVDWKAAYQRVQQKIAKSRRRRMTVVLISAAAAVAVLAVSLWVFRTERTANQLIQGIVMHDVPPGGNKAVLTLANGKQIVLDSNANGILGQQGNTRVINLSAGKLAYKLGKGNTGTNKQLQYNTLTTPRGGQYQVALPDGSKVWLNAESSLKYPTGFSGRQRIVKLTGEAYFEVAENENMPFKVELNGMEITVLGTHFNVMAYENEKNITTTLLEGKVKVTEAGKSKLLKPGQAASFDKASQRFSVAAANMEQAVAWKNGYFDFRDATLKTVMRQLSRWYDVEVHYQADIPVRRFTGQAPRDLNLSDVLKILATSGIHFSIENKRIIVKP